MKKVKMEGKPMKYKTKYTIIINRSKKLKKNQLLKKNIKENEVNLRKVIKELTNKANQLNEELLQSRKRTSLLRSKPSVENINMINEIEKYKKDIEKLKQENEKQKQKDKEEIESLETQL